MKIECLYSCDLCGLKRIVVKVEMRKAEQDLREWMDDLSIQLSADHYLRSPGCNPKTLTEVLIPSAEHDPVGMVSS